jgi:hypothetical protein
MGTPREASGSGAAPPAIAIPSGEGGTVGLSIRTPGAMAAASAVARAALAAAASAAPGGAPPLRGAAGAFAAAMRRWLACAETVEEAATRFADSLPRPACLSVLPELANAAVTQFDGRVTRAAEWAAEAATAFAIFQDIRPPTMRAVLLDAAPPLFERVAFLTLDAEEVEKLRMSAILSVGGLPDVRRGAPVALAAVMVRDAEPAEGSDGSGDTESIYSP